MSTEARDWMTAVACAEGPRPTVTFTDLPRQHRGEMLRFALVAAVSTAFFVTVGVLAQPLSSRSLAAAAALPDSSLSRAALLETRVAAEPPLFTPERLRRPAPRPGTGVRTVTVEEPRPSQTLQSRDRSRRRNVFSRFFHGMLRTVTTSA